MSQEINNREYRKHVLSALIAKLHDGQTVEDVKAEFEATFGGVSAEEIAAAEQSLIEGGLPVGEPLSGESLKASRVGQYLALIGGVATMQGAAGPTFRPPVEGEVVDTTVETEWAFRFRGHDT